MYNNVSLVYFPGNVISVVDECQNLICSVSIMYFIFKKVVSAPLMAPALVGTTVPTEPRQRQSTDVQMEHIMMLRDSMRKPSVKTAGKVR